MVRPLLFVALSIGPFGLSGAALQTPGIRVSSIRDCSAISKNDRDLAPLSTLCEFVAQMEKTLPNFICEQRTQRYFPFSAIIRKSEERRSDDAVSDTVTATVSYEDGTDQYTNVKIGDRPVGKSLLDLVGPVTTGDFGTELVSIFRAENGATFTFQNEQNGPTDREYLFAFRIPAALNHAFTLFENGSQTRPDLEGEIWVSKSTGEVYRLDMLAKNIDAAFSADHIRFSSIFGEVRFGDGREFLLPQRSESTICDRGRSCTRNVTQWKSCKKLSVETRILFPSPNELNERAPSRAFEPAPDEAASPDSSSAKDSGIDSTDTLSGHAVEKNPGQPTEASISGKNETPNRSINDAANRDIPGIASPRFSKDDRLASFIREYPNSLNDEKALDDWLQTYQDAEDSTELMDEANRLLKANSNNLGAIAVLIREKEDQVRDSSDPKQAAQLRTESAELARQALNVIGNEERPVGISADDYDRFVSRVTPIFYFALATPVDHTNEQDSRALFESKIWAPTVIEIQPSPITDKNERQARAIIGGQRELLLCTHRCSILGPGIYSGEVKQGQIRIHVASKKNGKTSIRSFRMVGTW